MADFDPQAYAFRFFTDHGWTPAQAAGILGGLRGETENLNTTQTHDNGTGLGIAGWNGQRLQGLRDFAQRQGTSPTDLQTQLNFVNQELNTTERAAGDALRQAQTPGQAGQAMLAYERPKDWNKPGAHPERAAYANQFYNQFNPGNSNVAAMPLPPPQTVGGAPGAPPLGAPQLPAPQQQQQQPQLPGGGMVSGAPQNPLGAPALAAPLAQPPAFTPMQLAQIQYYQRRFNPAAAFAKIPLPPGFQGYQG